MVINLDTPKGLVRSLEESYDCLYAEDSQTSRDESYLRELNEWAENRPSDKPVLLVSCSQGSREYAPKDIVTEVIIGGELGESLVQAARDLTRADSGDLKYSAKHHALCLFRITGIFIELDPEVPFERKKRLYDYCIEIFQCIGERQLELLLRTCEEASGYCKQVSSLNSSSTSPLDQLALNYDFLRDCMTKRFLRS